MPNFSLFDAMSAIEVSRCSRNVKSTVPDVLQIMDPRMDSALIPPGVTPPKVPFSDPNAPLLAEEVCWILDRTMSAEVSACVLANLTIFVLTRRSRWGGTPDTRSPRRFILRFTCTRSHPSRKTGSCRSTFRVGGMIRLGPWAWCRLSCRLGLWRLSRRAIWSGGS
jgi:hypothetical protein